MERKITLTPAEVEKLYGIPKGTLANWRCKREGPTFFKLRRRILYRKNDFENWLFRNRIQTRER